jgi:hypothetical protein
MDLLDAKGRNYAYSDAIEESFEKKYKYMSPDQQLLEFVMDKVAMTSDCYVLYAVAYFGAASKEMIIDFLKMKARTSPALLITKRDDVDEHISTRLRVLCDRGYLYSFKYAPEDGAVTLYGVTEEAYVVLRQRLDKVTFSYNHGFAHKSVRRILDWAGASYVGARLMQSPKVQFELERTFFNKKIKNSFLPFEFRSRDAKGNIYYVAGMNGNWDMDPDTQSEHDYDEWLGVQVELLWCYLTFRSTKGTPVAVVCVRDSATLIKTAGIIAKAEGLRGCLDRIVFTGEGILRSIGEEGMLTDATRDGAFLQMRIEGNQVVFSVLDKAAFV